MKRHLRSLRAFLGFALVLLPLSSACKKSPPPKPEAAREVARKVVAVLGLRDASPDPLGPGVTELLTAELAAGDALRVVSGSRVASFLRDTPIELADPLAADALGKVRKGLGADFVVVGAFSGNRITARLLDASSGATLATADLADTEPARSVTEIGATFRQKAGAPALGAAEAATAAAALPKSAKAARLYGAGLVAERAGKATEARDLLTKAVAEEPAFAAGQAALAGVSGALGFEAEASQAAKKTAELASALAARERLRLTAHAELAAGHLGAAIGLLRSLVKLHPDDFESGLHLARAEARAGSFAPAFETLAALRKLPRYGVDEALLDAAEAEAAFAAGDAKLAVDAAHRAASRASLAGDKQLAATAMLLEARGQRALGQRAKGMPLIGDARRTFEAAGSRAGVAWAETELAPFLADDGKPEDARLAREEALKIRKEIGDRAGAAESLRTLARTSYDAGKVKEARRLLEDAQAVGREAAADGSCAKTLVVLAHVLAAEASPLPARKAAEDAHALSREQGDDAGSASALAALSEVQLLSGDVAGARKSADGAVALADKAKSAALVGDALSRLGAVQLAADELKAARATFDKALATRRQAGLKPAESESALDLLRLTLEEGKPDDVVRDAPALLQDLQAARLPDHEAAARLLVVDAHLLAQRVTPAQAEYEKAAKLCASTENALVGLACKLTNARLELARSFAPAAEKAARIAERDAANARLPGLALEARFVLGQLQLAFKKQPTLLTAVQKDAAQQGYAHLALKAEQTLLGR